MIWYMLWYFTLFVFWHNNNAKVSLKYISYLLLYLSYFFLYFKKWAFISLQMYFHIWQNPLKGLACSSACHILRFAAFRVSKSFDIKK